MTIQYLYLALAITCTATGQFFYKKHAISPALRYIASAITLFIATPAFSYMALRTLSIDLVYISTSATILMVMLLSRFALKEESLPRHWLGCSLIAIGIIIYAY